MTNKCPMCNTDEKLIPELLAALNPFYEAPQYALLMAKEDPAGEAAQMLARNSKLTQAITQAAIAYKKATQ